MSRSSRSKTIQPNSITAKLMFVVGLLLIGLAVFLFVQEKQKLDRLPTTEAVVLDTHSGGKHSSNSYTDIEYKVGGQTYTHRFNGYVFFQSKGSRITVAYNSDDPNEVYETGFMGHPVPFAIAFVGWACLCPFRPIKRLKGERFD
ncbi:MAG: DUF3592 domain-containing protein [Oscillospiraceae bacterium]|nr:DUF3592 domain-containing protein [Oscillospiraceae bacterium]